MITQRTVLIVLTLIGNPMLTSFRLPLTISLFSLAVASAITGCGGSTTSGKGEESNNPPIVEAGIDQSGIDTVVQVSGAVRDDGRPSAHLTLAWSQISGPAGAKFVNPASAVTTVTLPGPGVYVLRLAADDGAAQVADEMSVTVIRPPSITLVDTGKSLYSILVETGAPRSVATAAEELQRYIERSTGVRLPIVPRATGPVISLGDTTRARTAGISASTLSFESFRRAVRGQDVFIVGLDLDRTPQGGASAGTANGVYAFIEDVLGVRWLLPGRMGEDVPVLNRVTVPNIDSSVAPAFVERSLPYIQNDLPAVVEWSRRQRLGRSRQISHGHAWQYVVPPVHFDAHPEWFAQIGKVRLRPSGDRYKLETTDESLVRFYAQAAIDAFAADARMSSFSLSPTDSAGWSQSAASLDLTETDPQGAPSVTPLVLSFYNRVARLVGERFPDRTLGGYIYADYLYPPAAGIPDLAPNLALVIAPSIDYGYRLHREDVRTQWKTVMGAWTAKSRHTMLYDLFNWLRNAGGGLTPPAPDICNFVFPRIADLGVEGIYVYGTTEWSQGGITNYLLARMAWNPRLDARKVCEEFIDRAYGPAAEPMAKLYALVDATVATYYRDHADARYTRDLNYMRLVEAPIYAQVEALYTQAVAASSSASIPQRERLRLFGDNLALLQWSLRKMNFIPTQTDSPVYRSDVDIASLKGRKDPAFGIVLAPELSQEPRTVPPLDVVAMPAIPNPRPVTAYRLYGNTRILLRTDADSQITITPTELVARDIPAYTVYDEFGTILASGILRVGETISIVGHARAVDYLEIIAPSSYFTLSISGARFALATDTHAHGLRLMGRMTPVYFRVPPELTRFTITTRTAAPGETSRGRLYSPSGRLVSTLDTVAVPAAEFAIKAIDMAGDWAGFWCLALERAPTGALDDVGIALDPALPPWVIVDPLNPLAFTALDRVISAADYRKK